jgi:23S rRNA pseudouridine1911/1915/1917 synthase
MPPDARERLDHYLVRLGWARSRRAAREMLAGGMVRVNGRVLRKGEMIGGGDAVEIAELSTLPALVPDPEVKIEVLFRDSAMLVVNKPAPMACHPLRPGERGTLMNGVVAAFPEATVAGDNPREGGLVHRLDNGTSGALLVALTPAAFTTLREAIRAGRIRRDYQALVIGNLKESLEIENPLAHDPRNARRMIAVAASAPGARTAATSIEPIRPYGDSRAPGRGRTSDRRRRVLWRATARRARRRPLLAPSCGDRISLARLGPRASALAAAARSRKCAKRSEPSRLALDQRSICRREFYLSN